MATMIWVCNSPNHQLQTQAFYEINVILNERARHWTTVHSCKRHLAQMIDELVNRSTDNRVTVRRWKNDS